MRCNQALWATRSHASGAKRAQSAKRPKRRYLRSTGSEWYAWRRELVAQAQPNPGHLALAQLESHLTGSQSRFTSIDISALVHPAASIPYAALQHGVILVEVNPEQTPLTSISTYVLSGLVGQVLPTLLQATF